MVTSSCQTVGHNLMQPPTIHPIPWTVVSVLVVTAVGSSPGPRFSRSSLSLAPLLMQISTIACWGCHRISQKSQAAQIFDNDHYLVRRPRLTIRNCSTKEEHQQEEEEEEICGWWTIWLSNEGLWVKAGGATDSIVNKYNPCDREKFSSTREWTGDWHGVYN